MSFSSQVRRFLSDFDQDTDPSLQEIIPRGRFARMHELFPKKQTAVVRFPRENMKLKTIGGHLKYPDRCAQCGGRYFLKLDDLIQCFGCMLKGYYSFTINGWKLTYNPQCGHEGHTTGCVEVEKL